MPTRACALSAHAVAKRTVQLFWLSEYLSHPDELGTLGVRIIEAVLYLTLGTG